MSVSSALACQISVFSTTERSNNRYYANHTHSYRGGNISVTRPNKSMNSSQLDDNGAAIKYSQSYTVQWGEHDETKLIQMNDFNAAAMKSSSRVSENDI